MNVQSLPRIGLKRNSFIGLSLFFGFLFLANSVFGQVQITAISPTSAAVGATVTITGSGFNASAGNNTVLVGKTKATVLSATSTSISFSVPSGTPGINPISVINLGTRKQFVFSSGLAITNSLTSRTLSANSFSSAVNLNNSNTSYGSWMSIGFVTSRESLKHADLNSDGSITLSEMEQFLNDPNEGVPYIANRQFQRQQEVQVIGNKQMVIGLN
jgi:hypothetical protein